MTARLSQRLPALPRRTPAAVVGLAGFVIMAGTQIAIPLSDERAALTTWVIVGFALATLGFAIATWGLSRVLLGVIVVVPLTLALEWVGTTSGFPFGDYEYTGVLEPTIAGVPIVVPLAWFAMGVPALEVGAQLAPGRLGRVAIAAVGLTAWDLFLDPQMVDEGYWTWAVDGAYRGIPISNYLGWLGASLVVLALLDLVRGPAPPGVPLLALYAWWAVMSTVGFLSFFDDAVVALVGGVVMIPLAGAALRDHLAVNRRP